jgi:hypothetical protein
VSRGEDAVKSAREVALDAAHRMLIFRNFDRSFLSTLLKDDGVVGRALRDVVEAFEKTIDADRLAHEKARAPS